METLKEVLPVLLVDNISVLVLVFFYISIHSLLKGSEFSVLCPTFQLYKMGLENYIL